jgi:hypothetical protein
MLLNNITPERTYISFMWPDDWIIKYVVYKFDNLKMFGVHPGMSSRVHLNDILRKTFVKLKILYVNFE